SREASGERRSLGESFRAPSASVNEQELVRAQQNLHVAAPRRRRQQLRIVLLRRSRGHAGHHPGFFLVRFLRRATVVVSGRGLGLGVVALVLGRFGVLPLFVGFQRLGCEERQAGLHLGGRGGAAEHESVRFVNSRGVVGLVRDTAREELALLLHEVAVHQEQALERNAGREALLGR